MFKKTICSYCGSEALEDEIEICEECGEELCMDCKDLDLSIKFGICVHSFHECDGSCKCCEDRLCFNDSCDMWDIEEHGGQLKSEWDENREFIMNLNPNDPADAWFFED